MSNREIYALATALMVIDGLIVAGLAGLAYLILKTIGY